jgi:NAD(P)-dependent dehydrogenase (short-subunit alcohol dehydrogenase family)
MQTSLKDQVALVTGAAHRVGKAIALELASRGAHIFVHYNSAKPEVVEQTLAEIHAHGVEAYPMQADVSRPEGVAAIFEALQARFGKLNILVNSASVFQKRRLMEVTLDDWELTMRVNLTAPFLCTQAAVPMMRANAPSGGAIVNIVDLGAIKPFVEYAHHGISKAGLQALSEVSAVTLGEYNIRVNSVLPGLALKPDDYSDAFWEELGKNTPLGRVGTAEDVARAVAYLCSEDYLTGVCIRIDGGEYLGG